MILLNTDIDNINTINQADAGIVLYDAAWTSFFPAMLLHRITVNRDKRALLMYDAAFYQQRKLEPIKFEKANIFEKVIPYKSIIGLGNAGKPTQQIEEAIANNLDEVFANEKIDLSMVDEIITMSDWYAEFGVYLSLKSIPYYWLESATDVAIDVHNRIYKEFDGRTKTYVNAYKLFYSASFLGKYVTPILLCSSEKSKKEAFLKSYIEWNPKELISSVTDDDMGKVFNAFDYGKEFDVNFLLEYNNKNMFIMQSDGWSHHRFDKRLSVLYSDLSSFKKRAIYANQLALDYYILLDAKIYIKSHPNDPYLTEESKILFGENADSFGVIASEFLFEHLKREKIKFSTILSFGSSANAYMSKLFDINIGLTMEYWNTYFLYNSIYVALVFTTKINKENIYCSPILKIQCENLFNYSLKKEKQFNEIPKNLNFAQSSFVLVNHINKEERSRWLNCLQKLPNDIVICFINVCEDYMFWSDDIAQFFVPIKIKKEKLKDDTLDPMRDEVIFVFSKSEAVRKAAREFMHIKILPRVGVILKIDKLSISEMVDIQKIASTAANFLELKNYVDKINSKIDTLYSATSFLLSNGMTKNVEISNDIDIEDFKTETNIYEYLELLVKVASNYLIIVTIKDTPGHFVDEKIKSQLTKVGLGKFPIGPNSNNLWCTYIGVIDSGNIVHEDVGKNEEPLFWQAHYEYNLFIVSSQAWRNGNRCEIKINNIDYAVNGRGLNIVVFDKNNGNLVDSVCFDCHVSDFSCSRALVNKFIKKDEGL